MRKVLNFILFASLLFMATAAYAVPGGLISTDRFGYSGTVDRYATLLDAQNKTNLVSTVTITNRDLALYISNVDENINVIMGSWWYTTHPSGNAGYGNTTGNSGMGFLQLYDEDGSTTTSRSFSFGDFDGTYYTSFSMNLTGINANAADYSRFWVDFQGGGADKVIFHNYELDLKATGLEGVASNSGIEAFNHPTGVVGDFTGLFQNVSTTYPQNNAYYVFDLDLNMINWAYANRNSLTGDPFSPSHFVQTPEPGTFLLMGIGAAGALYLRRRKGKVE